MNRIYESNIKKISKDFLNLTALFPRFSEHFWLPLSWLMVIFRKVIRCVFSMKRFQLTWIGKIMWNQLLGLLLRKLKSMRNNCSHLKVSFIFKCIAFVRALDITLRYSSDFYTYLEVHDKSQRICTVIGPRMASRFQ